jgi:hypothetical protein
MKWTLIMGCIAFVGAHVPATAANAAPRTYSYVITHPLYGTIGTYDRTVDDADGVTRAQSRLRVAVRILGFVAHREDADQTEIWRGDRLISFHTVTTTNGHRLSVSGEARDNRFLVTSPAGTTAVPADVEPSDPWSLNRMGAGVVVSIKTGKIDPVQVTGGEMDTVTLHGVSAPARHFHINTAAQPDKWEVWFNQQGMPIEFRSTENGGAVSFFLVSSSPQPSDTSGPLALEGSRSRPDQR